MSLLDELKDFEVAGLSIGKGACNGKNLGECRS